MNRGLETEHLIQHLTHLNQHWECLLFSTEGAINLQKSHWYLMMWLWREGIPRHATSHEAPGSLYLTAGYSRDQEIIPLLAPTDGFCTLGVCLSPSGTSTLQTKILREHADKYKSQLLSSTLMPSEAYCCYMQYKRPRLTYSLACSTLSQQQCRYVQAPAPEAILPKLHLNRYTPRAILFASSQYGGLEIPEKYTDQGYFQLKLMVGHLKLKDEVGNLIMTLITHTQVQTGSAQPFFTLPYPTYHKWIDHTWVTSTWKFKHPAKLTIDLENPWTPKLSRENDGASMEMALRYNFMATQLYILNLCRLHLQVTTLSDITDAAGRRLELDVIEGHRHTQRESTIDWPVIPPPPKAHWNLLRRFLQELTQDGQLTKPLGRWILVPQQNWYWFVDSSGIVYQKPRIRAEWKHIHQTQVADASLERFIPLATPPLRPNNTYYTPPQFTTAPILVSQLPPAIINSQRSSHWPIRISGHTPLFRKPFKMRILS